MSKSLGKYLLILNPDTILGEDTLRKLYDYMEDNPAVGICGPKILTREGNFDIGSKRGIPTPWVAFSRLSGLAYLFPKSRTFGGYDLLYLNENEIADVDALSGSCMLIRREAYEQTGGFDEDYFMYGEDIDLCYRYSGNGWKVRYVPITKIVHFRGESTRRSDIDKDSAFYGAMHLFVSKHFKGRYPAVAHLFIDFGIVLAMSFSKIKKLLRVIIWPSIDLISLWIVLAASRIIRWGSVLLSLPVVGVISLQAIVWTACLTGFGAYGRARGQVKPLALGMILGFFINSSFTYFFKQFAYSRFVNIFGLVVGFIAIWSWRKLIKAAGKTGFWVSFHKRRSLIVGKESVAKRVIHKLQTQERLPYLPVGVIDPDEDSIGKFIEGLPVLGGEAEIDFLVELEEIEEVIFAYEHPDYVRVLESVNRIKSRRGVNFKVIPPESTQAPDADIPFLTVEYLTPRGMNGVLRKFSTLIFKR